MKRQKNLAVFVAGGTGGHINAAKTLGSLYERKNFDVLYLTGTRPLDYRLYKDMNVIHLESWPLKYKNPIKILRSIIKNTLSFFRVLRLFIKNRPSFILGAGGYICGPTLLAGKIIGVPTFILEQNSVLGLTNRILSSISNKIFVHFTNTIGLKNSEKIVVSGNPVREEFFNLFASTTHRKDVKTGFLKILVFGGSLGAESINNLIRKFISLNSDIKLWIRHQTGLSKKAELNFTLGENIKYEALEYLDSIEKDYEWADLILCRSGASSLAELRIVQKPAILIPYKLATHNHQWHNARLFANEVKFPVYIHEADSLEANQCSLLKEIIAKEYKSLYVLSHSKTDIKVMPPQSSQIIFNEINKYVQK